MKKIITLLAILCLPCHARQEEEKDVVREGNLALRSSQQPGPLFGFGQTIIDEGDFQGYGYIGHLKGKTFRATSVMPFVIYGLRDDLALAAMIPITAQLHDGNESTWGIVDVVLQAEYAVYSKQRATYSNQISVVFTMSLPSASSTNFPSLNAATAFTASQSVTGSGSPSFFVGATASHLATDWYLFASPGVLFTVRDFNTKQGNQFLYEFAFGKNISYSDNHIFTWLIEFDGGYTQHTKVCGVPNPDTGGSVFSIGPSIWYSREQFILQAGFSIPVSQVLFGEQDPSQFFAAVSLGWTFNT